MRQNTLEVCLPSVLGSIRRSGLPQFILYQSFLKLMPVLLWFLLGKLTILFPSKVGGASFVFPRYPRSFGHRKRFVSRTRRLSRLHVMCVLAFLPSILFRAFFSFLLFLSSSSTQNLQYLKMHARCKGQTSSLSPFLTI